MIVKIMLGNFWLESDGKRILFELENMKEWYGERYNDSEHFH